MVSALFSIAIGALAGYAIYHFVVLIAFLIKEALNVRSMKLTNVSSPADKSAGEM